MNIIKFMALGLGLLAALLSVAIWAIPPSFYLNQTIRLIENRYPVRVRLNRATIHLRPGPKVILEGLTVATTAADTPTEVFQAEHIEFRSAWHRMKDWTIPFDVELSRAEFHDASLLTALRRDASSRNPFVLERAKISHSSLHLGQSIFAIQGQVTPEQGIDLTLTADPVTTAAINALLATPASLPMIEGLALELHYQKDLRGASAASVTGKVKSAAFKLGSVQAQDFAGRFQYDNGVINFAEFSAKILDAKWSGQGRLDTSGPELAYQIEGTWQGVELAKLTGSASQLAGPGELRLKVEGVGSGPDWLQQLRGTGHFSITSPKLGALRPFEAVFNGPAWQLVERVPGAIDRHFLAKLSSLDDQLRKLSAAFEFKGWGIQLTKLELHYPNASVRLTGAMDWEEQIKWSGYLSVQSDFVTALLLDPQLRDGLLLHRRELKVPLELTGTLQEPVISGPEEFLTRRFQDFLRAEEQGAAP